MKPQKMNACISPGTSRCSSLLWPSTITASLAHAGGHVVEPRRRLAEPDDPVEQTARRANRPPADGERRQQRDQRDAVYPAPAFRSSAVIAGITSCRSPITA